METIPGSGNWKLTIRREAAEEAKAAGLDLIDLDELPQL